MVVGILVAVALAAGLVWGAVWLLVAFVSWVAGLLGAAGTGLWHLLQAADRAVTPDLIRLGGYLSGPVHAWLERHAGQLPFSVKSMFGGWWALGLFVWWRARRKRGAGVLAFGVWAGATLAVMWAGAEPEARTATLAVAALVASLLVLPLLPYGLFSSHVTVEAPKAPAAKPAVEAGPVVPAPRPAWLAEAVRVVAAVPGGLAPEAVAVRLGRSRDEAVVRAVLRGAAERGELAHREVYVHPDHT
ncbi:hypothetical protein [Kitasatospora sp. NPDC006786]|uniref:hypothetical protein n=1 Tax=unclassified Kitasatospora TaxID=2633591 RepID=UPI0034115A19